MSDELEKRIEALETALAKAEEEKKSALGEKFKVAKDLKAAQEALRDAEENASAANSTELEKTTRALKKANEDLIAANERADKLETTRRNERANSLIASALNSANVDARHTTLLSKALRADVEFSDDGEPMIGGKNLQDYARSYFAPKGDGHSYVRAANNGGGAATGHDGTKPPRMTKDNFNMTEFAMIQKENPEEANAIADAVGRPGLKINLGA